MTSLAEQDQQQVVRAEAVLAAYRMVQHVKQRGLKLAALRLRPPPVTKRQLLHDYGRSQYRVSRAPESAREEDKEGARRWSVQSTGSRRRSSMHIEGVSLLPRELYDAVRPECIHKLQVVDLRGTQLGDKGLVQVCDVLRDAPIHTLVLSDNGITDKGVTIFAKYARFFSCLKTLMLNANKITSQGVSLLLHHDLHNGSIERLNLQLNHLCPLACHWLYVYFKLDHSLSNLRCLNLGGKSQHLSIGDAGVTVLVAGLVRPVPYPLVELAISDSGMTLLGAKAIATLLVVSDYLKRLNVSCNSIGEEGLALLEIALQANTSVQQIDVGMCGVDEAHAARVRLFACAPRPPLSWRQKRHLAGVAIALLEHVMFYRTKHERYFGHERVGVDDRFASMQAAKVRIAVDTLDDVEGISTGHAESRQPSARSEMSHRSSRGEAWRESNAFAAISSAVHLHRAAQSIELKLGSGDTQAKHVRRLRHSRELKKVADLVAFATEADAALGAELGAALYSYSDCQQVLDAWMASEPSAPDEMTAFTDRGERLVNERLALGQEVHVLLRDLVQFLQHKDGMHEPFCQSLTAAAVVVEQVLSKSVIRRPKSRATPRTPQSPPSRQRFM